MKQSILFFNLLTLLFINTAYAKETSLNKIEEHMQHAVKRHQILSENIAAQDIPKYRAKDLAPISKSNNHQKLQAFATSNKHLTRSRNKNNFRTKKDPYDPNTTIRGNNVNLPDQMLKVTENMNDFNSSSTIYKKLTGLVKTSLGR